MSSSLLVEKHGEGDVTRATTMGKLIIRHQWSFTGYNCFTLI